MPALYTGLAIIAWMTFATLVAGAIIAATFMLADAARRKQTGGDGADGSGDFKSEHGGGN